MTDVPATVVHAGIVLRETVQIALAVAVLNALKVMAEDNMNAYIVAPNE